MGISGIQRGRRKKVIEEDSDSEGRREIEGKGWGDSDRDGGEGMRIGDHQIQSTHYFVGRLACFDDYFLVLVFLLLEVLRALDGLEEGYLPIHVLGVAVLLLIEGDQIDVRELAAGLDVLQPRGGEVEDEEGARRGRTEGGREGGSIPPTADPTTCRRPRTVAR